jgi:hypothetical protein
MNNNLIKYILGFEVVVSAENSGIFDVPFKC